MSFLPLAAMEFIPLAGIAVGFGLLVVLPVVAILTEHQRKMARILNGQATAEELAEKSSVVIGLHANMKGQPQADNAVVDELRALRGEIADLRMQVASIQGQTHQESVRDRLTQS